MPLSNTDRSRSASTIGRDGAKARKRLKPTYQSVGRLALEVETGTIRDTGSQVHRYTGTIRVTAPFRRNDRNLGVFRAAW